MDHQGAIDSMSTSSKLFLCGVGELFHMDIWFGDTVNPVRIFHISLLLQ